jgi:CBS domain containing-hemolysin-like protein
MEHLDPQYLAEIARQIGFVSAVLAGFCAAFLGTLIGIRSESRAASWTISTATLSAVSFVCAVIASTKLVVVLHPAAPKGAAAAAGSARIVFALSFILGLYSLLAAIALTGWVRSRRMGIVTTVLALAGAIVASWLI